MQYFVTHTHIGAQVGGLTIASGSHCSNVRTLFTRPPTPPALKIRDQLEHLCIHAFSQILFNSGPFRRFNAPVASSWSCHVEGTGRLLELAESCKRQALFTCVSELTGYSAEFHVPRSLSSTSPPPSHTARWRRERMPRSRRSARSCFTSESSWTFCRRVFK